MFPGIVSNLLVLIESTKKCVSLDPPILNIAYLSRSLSPYIVPSSLSMHVTFEGGIPLSYLPERLTKNFLALLLCHTQRHRDYTTEARSWRNMGFYGYVALLT